MSDRIHLVIPMSGQGKRYQAVGYQAPKPLIPVNGRPMILRLLEKFPAAWPKTFVLAENHRVTELENILRQACPEAQILYVPVHSEGPGKALECAVRHLPLRARVLVSYCDFGMNWDAEQFETFVATNECDSCLISYRGFHAHYLSEVTYAYSHLQGERVVEVKEKGSFTDNRENEYASAGAYYFKSSELLAQALAYQFAHDIKMNGEYYTSLTVQALLQMRPDSHVRVFEIPTFFQWGTPTDLKIYEYWERTFQAYNRFVSARLEVAQTLIPMAGRGSRFQQLTQTPKPLISVLGQPMFKTAQASLPKAKKNVVVSLSDFASRLDVIANADDTIVYIEDTPEGQALSVAAGLAALDANENVIVSSCDHSIVLNPKIWSEFQKIKTCDAAIFTIRGFPGTIRTPHSFAYVKTDANDAHGVFSRVHSVSVKTPISEKPAEDLLLVGTFWFKNPQLLKQAINELQQRNLRVNNELYLDSVFEIMITQGLEVRIIPLDGYVNWGDPASMAEGLYWYEAFLGRRHDQRPRFPGVFNAEI